MPLVQQVDVTDPHGYVRRVVFGSTGYMASDTHAVGQGNLSSRLLSTQRAAEKNRIGAGEPNLR